MTTGTAPGLMYGFGASCAGPHTPSAPRQPVMVARRLGKPPPTTKSNTTSRRVFMAARRI
jgi:hypothetical protein